MKKFFKDLKRYNPYALYAAKAELKSGVADSYLNWLWWIFDPILFMLVYTFVVKIVFNATEPNFPLFVFVGLTAWDFFNKTMLNSVKLVRTNKSIVTKIYLPKYMLVLTKMYVNAFKMAISFALVIILMFIYSVELTFNLLYIPLILVVLFVLTFAFASLFMHFGVFIEDLSNVITVLLRLMFYMSGVFYSIQGRITGKYAVFADVLMYVNPLALIINSLRDVMLYGTAPNVLALLAWLLIGILATCVSVHTVYKYENSYTKVM
ncbi:MAG: ABC transporter permease [Oscillospiraceae bacterium]|nr:ABC transporter permease [Oscillospiraceae bacterium]